MKLLFSLFLLLAASSIAFAGTNCTDRPECWPGGSAMNVGLTAAQQRQATEKRLARTYAELVGLVSASSTLGEQVAQPLKAEQEEWYKYRDAECSLIGALTGAGGTWPDTYAVECESNLTDQRLRRVRSAIRCINRYNKSNQEIQESSCLQQLAPIANRL